MSEVIDISVIVPVFNEEESLPELSEWISRVMQSHGFTYEVLMIDDGSSDKSWKVITGLHEVNPHVKGIRFNRNYGKSAALDTGFRYSKGGVVITMDADLQDSPDEIPDLYRLIKNEGYDLISGWKKTRHDPLSKTIPSKFFNKITRMISGIELHDFNCGLKAYSQDVVKNIRIYGEMHRYIPLIAKWNGFKVIGEKEVEHRARKYGVTKFGLERFIFGFLDLLSVTFVSKFKKSPMHFFGTLGTLSFLMGLIITVVIIGEKLYNIYTHTPAHKVRDVVDQPLFFLALVAIILGTQLFLAGFLGELFTINNLRRAEYLVKEEAGLEEVES